MDIFERAARAKLRFATPNGLLTVEQLFDLPLTARSTRGLDLDTVAKANFAVLKEHEVGSFVDAKPDKARIDSELRMEIIKHVIASKQADAAAAVKAMETVAKKAKLIAALENKENQELTGMSREELQAELAKLA